MAEQAGDDGDIRRQSPRIEEDETNHSPTPPEASDNEEEIAEDRVRERVPSPVSPVPRFRSRSPEPAQPDTPLLLNSEGV